MDAFNGFRGAARRLDDIDLPRIGYRIRVGEDEVHALMDVEASGGAWDVKGRPKMLFEPHRFYRNLGSGPKRDQAVAAGLAYQKWGEQPYPKDSYPRLIEAMKIDETAALKSASWGLGQILGENFAMVGYDTPQAMVRAFLDDAEVHLEAMISFIIAAGLDDELRAHNWSAFARGYNGPQYAKLGYHTKLAAAYRKWARIRDTPWSPADEIRVPETAQQPEVAVPTAPGPAPIGHNGGPRLTEAPSPVEQSAKAVGAGKWTAITGAVWTTLVAFDVLPPELNTAEASAAILTLVGAVAAAVGAYVAPRNAEPTG